MTIGNPDPTPLGDLSHQFVLTVGSLAIAGIMITALRSRVNGLWTHLSAAARTDMLTGLLNSHGLEEVLATEIERARPDAQRVGLMTRPRRRPRQAQPPARARRRR